MHKKEILKKTTKLYGSINTLIKNSSPENAHIIFKELRRDLRKLAGRYK